jgi:hypothetical protein
MPSNKPLEWTGHLYTLCSASLGTLPATNGKRWAKPLRGRFNSLKMFPWLHCMLSRYHHRCSVQLGIAISSIPTTLLGRQ